MWTPRVVPCLLLKGRSLVKTTRFDAPKYVGDPGTAVQIFNEKEVDEVIVLDITASAEGRGPDLDTIETIACECFMPLTYGGGIATLDHIESLFAVGVEKVSLNSALHDAPALLTEAASRFGSQSLVASIDAHRIGARAETWRRGGGPVIDADPATAARRVEELGAGEILITSVDREGTGTGFDVALTREVADAVDLPVVASGGAGSLDHVGEVLRDGGATAAALGSLVVFHGRTRAVLINFPDRQSIRQAVRLE